MFVALISVREASPSKAGTAIMAQEPTRLGLIHLLTLAVLAIKEPLGKLWVVLKNLSQACFQRFDVPFL